MSEMSATKNSARSPFLVLIGSQIEGECDSLDDAVDEAREINDQRIRDGGWGFNEPIRVVQVIEAFDNEHR